MFVAFRYYSSVDELLTSIKKTEDSLLRLKQLRKAAAGISSQLPAAKSGEMSDENKIRHQIHLDAEEFGRQVRQLVHVSFIHFSLDYLSQ